ncbi:Carotenoid 9,10(9',10')-cleavage dioxygenase 1 [Sesamum alatum]|uniref:Carotenoid 9,10(9',10')-cleavage dioxygenase 1 n=1 Tax=Sesamum alatum TaxID=300844 RepID=A0AAE2CFA3_9LAMI|nr:Carotenoid 9,10(9',10')-cleavage dioxygenase 1 [Sesamum alatum]
MQISTTIDNLPKTIKESSVKLLDEFVDRVFEFADQPYLPSQSNFAPVDEIGQPVQATLVHGSIPRDFPEGVYIRNGPNPLFGGLKSTKSIFGKSSHTWIEGEGMLHALYFSKDSDGRWKISYNNRHVETDTFKHEKDRKKPAFLPAIEGDSPAVLLAYLLNWIRFGSVNKYLSNTSVFEHSGKFYSAAENYIPQEIDILTLETRRNWDINGDWTRPFTSHPKKAPGTGELVIMGICPQKPYFELGIVSADGKKLLHKVDLKLNRCCLCHEIGVTRRYNVIMDFPLTLDINRLVRGGPLIKYNKKGYARIGIMPRYGDADSVRWFEVEPSCIFHIINCYEQDDEVIVLACRARNSIIPGPDFGSNKFEWFSKGFKRIGALEETDEESEDESFLSRVYEWKLNMLTGEVAEKNLTGAEYSMDFPVIHETYIGKKNKFGYTQVVDSNASSIAGMAKYGGLAKLYFEERELEMKVEYHKFPENTFCSGAAFVAKSDGVEEDDGWIITYVHNEDNDVSQVYIVDAKNFSHEPVAKITLPRRVPYGFHGAFMPLRP